MKRNFFRFIVVLSCLMTLNIPTFAYSSATRGSDQISAYYIEVTTDPGRINVEFSVTGVGRVDKLGCESIYVYAKQDSRWRLVEAWVEDDEGMSRSNTFVHSNVIFATAPPVSSIRSSPPSFLKTVSAGDTRSETTYVTGE